MLVKRYLNGKIGLLALLMLLSGCVNAPLERRSSPNYTAEFDECVASALDDLGNLSPEEKGCVGQALIDWSVMSE